MITRNHESIGIVGGLCPLATADIYLKAMKQVKADTGDVDYPDIVINIDLEQQCRGNRFDDTSRHRYDMSHRILYIYQVSRSLKQHGISRILIPDFLSYSYAKTICDNIRIPLIDIVTILTESVCSRWPDISKVGLLTTSFAREQNIFEKSFSGRNLQIIYPDDEIQQHKVMEAVYGRYGVKKGFLDKRPGELIQCACEHLIAKGAEVVISAITELPLIDCKYYPPENYLDCNEAIAAGLMSHSVIQPIQAKQKTIGILGGLGPAATVDIFDKIIMHTPASKDQDHFKVIIESNPQIPDRTAALLKKEEDPSVAMLAAAEKLVASGADFIIVPCNTAHAFLPSIQQHVSVPVLSMIEATARYIKKEFPHVNKVGLLATTGTVKSAVYADVLEKQDIKLVVPSPQTQENSIMQAIYGPEGIKAGFKTGLSQVLLSAAAQELVQQGAQLIILGCTEIPLALKEGDVPVPLADPTDILAQAAVKYAMNISV